MTKPYQLRWGILATGGIAQTFGKDILLDPKTRGIEEIEHVVVAAAASSSQTRAREFLDKIGAGSTSVAYGSYKELVDDSNVDIIYIATPHSHHYQHCMLCLEAGKNVLCEKAFTANAEQLALLIEKAREKNVFLMEAVSYYTLCPSRIYPANATGLDEIFPSISICTGPYHVRYYWNRLPDLC